MGAKYDQDLTGESTHLVCGELNTPKYKYVAKSRPNVKCMNSEWIDAMYDRWIEGDDIRPHDYEAEYRLGVFEGLKIAVTGILDRESRTPPLGGGSR